MADSPASNSTGPNPGDVSWLDDDERAAWLSLIAVTVRLPQELDRQLRQEAGMSHFEYQVLVMLSEHPERTMRMSALASVVDGSLPRLSQVVAKMERRGWVRRTPDPTDGRYTLAVLTDDGWDTIVETAPGHVAKVRELVFDPLLPSHVGQLRRVCERILGAIEAGPCPEGRSSKGSGRSTEG